MPIANVGSRWTDGKLEFIDGDGNVIVTLDGPNRELSVPNGGTLVLESGASIENEGDLFTAFDVDDVTLAELANVMSVKAASLVGTQMAVAADANVIGAVPLIHRVLVASGANGSVDVVLTHKSRVIDVWAVLKGAGTAGCTLQVKNGTTNAITPALDVSGGADQAVFRTTKIDDAYHEIAAAGTLRVTKASSGADFPGAEVYVSVLRVA